VLLPRGVGLQMHAGVCTATFDVRRERQRPTLRASGEVVVGWVVGVLSENSLCASARPAVRTTLPSCTHVAPVASLTPMAMNEVVVLTWSEPFCTSLLPALIDRPAPRAPRRDLARQTALRRCG
jgi:hypothetical protein